MATLRAHPLLRQVLAVEPDDALIWLTRDSADLLTIATALIANQINQARVNESGVPDCADPGTGRALVRYVVVPTPYAADAVTLWIETATKTCVDCSTPATSATDQPSATTRPANASSPARPSPWRRSPGSARCPTPSRTGPSSSGFAAGVLVPTG
ncbi:hypothetical protein ACTXG6_04275 [Pseudonocardia sp. Cha107L01]|uniref:hypothetical protein n=1 Tax=Pseudonocardia sp. Cha107L01 TaxID=3457576 RepID=UPI00403E8D9A